MEEDDGDTLDRNEGVATPTAASQNGDAKQMDEVEVGEETNVEPQFQRVPVSSQSPQYHPGMLRTHHDISSHDIKIIKRFLEFNGYSRDQKKLAIAIGWGIGDKGLQVIEAWIARHGDEVDR